MLTSVVLALASSVLLRTSHRSSSKASGLQLPIVIPMLPSTALRLRNTAHGETCMTQPHVSLAAEAEQTWWVRVDSCCGGSGRHTSEGWEAGPDLRPGQSC